MTTDEKTYAVTLPLRNPNYWKASPRLQELIRRLDPILPLLHDVSPGRDDSDILRIFVSLGEGADDIIVTVEHDLLILELPVRLIPATAEKYATLLSRDQEGPWCYQIDDMEIDDMALVMMMGCLASREVDRLDQWVLEMLKECRHILHQLEVLDVSHLDDAGQDSRGPGADLPERPPIQA